MRYIKYRFVCIFSSLAFGGCDIVHAYQTPPGAAHMNVDSMTCMTRTLNLCSGCRASPREQTPLTYGKVDTERLTPADGQTQPGKNITFATSMTDSTHIFVLGSDLCCIQATWRFSSSSVFSAVANSLHISEPLALDLR